MGGTGWGEQTGKGLSFTPALTGREQNSVCLQKHNWRQEEIQGKLQKLEENGRSVSDYPRLWNCGSIKV